MRGEHKETCLSIFNRRPELTQVTKRMEERHSVSDPRPLLGGGGDGVKDIPKWEVDIIRDGNVIVDTFVVHEEVLPPRKNKKGKVLWRLPDNQDKTVSSK